MSHETHGPAQTEKKSVISMRSSFWFVLILVFLFIAALNFINVMGHQEEGHEPHATEHSEAHATEAGATHEEHAAPATEAEHTESQAEPAHEEAQH